MRLKNTLKATAFCVGVSLLVSGCDAASFLKAGSSAPQTSTSAAPSETEFPPVHPTEWPITPDDVADSDAAQPDTEDPADPDAEPTSTDDAIDNTAKSATAEPTSVDASADPIDDAATSANPEPVAVDSPVTSTTPSATPTARGTEVAEGWREVYREDFNGSLEDAKWEAYGWDRKPVGSGGMGIRAQENAFTKDGNLILQTKYEDGEWTSGGTSSGNVFTASRGKWEVRAKFPDSEGLGYCFLLWPADEGWPPEIDFAEGSATNPRIAGTYHWDPDNKQEQREFHNTDLQGWHTYGVIVEDDVIIFTLDGKETARIEQEGITDKEMFLGVQAAPLDPNGEAAEWETTVEGGVPNAKTPAISEIEIDWVAHYNRS